VFSDQAREALRLLVDLADRHLASSRDLLLLGIIHGLSRHVRSGFQALSSDLRIALVDALEKNPTASVHDLAHTLRRSREGLTRACRRQCGRPLADVLRDWRLDRASDMLRGSDRSIDDIAMRVGFQAIGGFYKAFQRRHGCSPGQWRSQSIGRINGES
jgi:transcriptional regulator GlxA family with amidase domain